MAFHPAAEHEPLEVRSYPQRVERTPNERPTTPSQALHLVRDPHRAATAEATRHAVVSTAAAPRAQAPAAAAPQAQPATATSPGSIGQTTPQPATQAPQPATQPVTQAKRRWWWPFGRRRGSAPAAPPAAPARPCSRCGEVVPASVAACRLGHRQPTA